MADVGVALAHAELAARQLARGEHGAAFESLAAALRLAPGEAALWAQFSDLIRYFNLRHPVPAPVRELLAAALEHPAVDPGNLVRPISTLALSRGASAAFDEPLLLKLLEDAVIRDAELERLIVEKRRALLEAVRDAAPPLELAIAIAHQCFNAEYVFDETADEAARIAQLREAILASPSPPPHWYAVYAAYRPLLSLPNRNVPLAQLAQRQIDEPLEEAELRRGFKSLAIKENSTSAAVRAQYEANPYPRWVRTQTAGFGPPPHPVAPDARILLAGCGTGQNAIATAQRFPGSRVLAVDLSLASLGYAMRKTRELGLAERIEYRQADLLTLGDLNERFDFIECSGVLHHLEDPLEGWRVLHGLLKPDGFMRVGLYSEAGRRDVARARALIAQKGLKGDLEGIRACRAEIRAHPQDALLARLARNEDFFSASGCRDLLLHVHEVCLTLPQVAQMIEALGLEFLGFELADSGATLERYRARFPADAAAASLANWHALEQKFPDTFTRPYQFWVRAAA
jgi:2-polyprenyl-3-methyl-5-hydroxy-6-metoxy-1,4-benzoquinol methylase